MESGRNGKKGRRYNVRRSKSRARKLYERSKGGEKMSGQGVMVGNFQCREDKMIKVEEEKPLAAMRTALVTMETKGLLTHPT